MRKHISEYEAENRLLTEKLNQFKAQKKKALLEDEDPELLRMKLEHRKKILALQFQKDEILAERELHRVISYVTTLSL